MALAAHEAGMGQNREMRRHRVLWHAERAREIAGRDTLGFMPHEQPKSLEPCGLGQRGKGRYCIN